MIGITLAATLIKKNNNKNLENIVLNDETNKNNDVNEIMMNEENQIVAKNLDEYIKNKNLGLIITANNNPTKEEIISAIKKFNENLNNDFFDDLEIS
ncbi:hypothetical protein [Metamycoplasma alkalescens]|uniref:Phosphoacetylglucosamine mutase n=1 Tax=Metamycoplasma alkalescens TaxID=45363 RepID=A0A318UCY3_9BACT|nr:hypothetical protein [Metamycoplasma alkalescens]PYF43639.1 phosphoacetylglucosamine mutase [Metamycoplasma alkalescens]SYV89661.1 Uncharacterised protein [Metamycoplasma alkalescens]